MAGKITKLTRNNVDKIYDELQAELDKVGNRMGVSLKLGNCTIDLDEGSIVFKKFRLQVDDQIDESVPENWRDNPKMVSHWNEYRDTASRKGLPATAQGKTFEHRGDVVMVAGYNRKAYKRPVMLLIVGDRNGAYYSLPLEYAKKIFKEKGLC